MSMTIFKVLTTEQWQAAERGELIQAPVDKADGYVHFSTRLQLSETLARHFKGQTSCVLAAFEADIFESDLKWEKSRGGDLFPHVYGPVRATQAHAIWLLDIDKEGVPIVPEEVERARDRPSANNRPDTIS